MEDTLALFQQYSLDFYVDPLPKMSRPSQGDIYLSAHPVAGKDASGGIVVITNECNLAYGKTELVSILPIFVVIPELLKKFGISEKDWN